MRYLEVNSVKTNFLILSPPFHIHSILKLAPVLSQNQGKCIWCALSAALPQKRVRWPPSFISFHFNKNSASFRQEKNWHKSMFSFWAILLNWSDWAITCRIARVQFNSTLDRKVKTRAALKSIFLVRKWINNTLKSNSVWRHMHHRKNLSFLSSFALPAVFVKGS